MNDAEVYDLCQRVVTHTVGRGHPYYDDLVQEAALQVFPLRDDDRPRAYLAQAARRRVYDYLPTVNGRRVGQQSRAWTGERVVGNRREPMGLATTAITGEQRDLDGRTVSEDVALRLAYEDAVRQLPARMMAVHRLAEEGFTSDEIADLYGVQRKTVNKSAREARSKLQEVLK